MAYTLYYIEALKPNHFYVGVSADILNRIDKHCRGEGSRFTTEFGCKRVFIKDGFDTAEAAKAAEKQHVIELVKKGIIACGGPYSSMKSYYQLWAKVAL